MVLETNLTVVSTVAFVVLQADKVRPKPAIINHENMFRPMYFVLITNLLSCSEHGRGPPPQQMNQQQDYADDEEDP